jgi:glutathione synthase/RimK-type ligase-like ATP-grasp enzyme
MNKKAQSWEALVIGRAYTLMWSLPQMLTRAGFIIDVISSAPVMNRSKFIRHHALIPPHLSLLPTIRKKLNHAYDWIIVTDDDTLIEIAHSSLSLSEKLRLLPLLTENDFSHIYSKIGLSKLFHQKGVCTPDFLIASNLYEAVEGAQQLGYPVLIKENASGAGLGVFECRRAEEVKYIKPQVFDRPVLLQKKIEGSEYDLSALYFEGKLIHFSRSKIEKRCCNPFGASSVRRYYPLNRIDKNIFANSPI